MAVVIRGEMIKNAIFQVILISQEFILLVECLVVLVAPCPFRQLFAINYMNTIHDTFTCDEVSDEINQIMVTNQGFLTPFLDK